MKSKATAAQAKARREGMQRALFDAIDDLLDALHATLIDDAKGDLDAADPPVAALFAIGNACGEAEAVFGLVEDEDDA